MPAVISLWQEPWTVLSSQCFITHSYIIYFEADQPNVWLQLLVLYYIVLYYWDLTYRSVGEKMSPNVPHNLLHHRSAHRERCLWWLYTWQIIVFRATICKHLSYSYDLSFCAVNVPWTAFPVVTAEWLGCVNKMHKLCGCCQAYKSSNLSICV